MHHGIRTLPGQYDYQLAVWTSFAPDGKRLAVASESWDSARILEVATGEVLAEVPGQRTVAFSPDGKILATESSEVQDFYRVELWDTTLGKSAGRLTGHKGQIESIVFSADGRLLATGSADGTARLWDLEERRELLVLRGHHGGAVKVAFLLGEKSLATASIDGTVKIWQVATGRLLLTLDVATDQVTGMAVSGDGHTLITAGSNLDGSHRLDLWPAPAE